VRRKGARRIAEIPRAVLHALNEGREETITLVEWLAIDDAKLLASVLPDAGFTAAQTRVAIEHAAKVAGLGIQERVKRIGAQLHVTLRADRRRERRFEALAMHGSDRVRSLAAYSVTADDALPLAKRLALAKRFAADRAMSVRECAWDSFRPWLARDLARGLELLEPWVRDRDEGVRRCAVEATRPRGVWTRHLEELKAEPQRARRLLDPVRSDPSDYVRRSVGNWLNDASKSQPEWVRALAEEWGRTSKTAETAWIVRHALRTLRKGGG
jgi:3-methyladenine DNA glycosylase AlkC